MDNLNFVLPIVVMVFIKIFLTFRLLLMAYQNIKSKKVNLNQFQLYEGNFPDNLWSARYQFQNMFEIPILFYVLSILNILLGNAGTFDLAMAWGFVIFRFFHFLVRLKNQKDLNIRPRTLFFVCSLICLSFGWINLIINNFLG